MRGVFRYQVGDWAYSDTRLGSGTIKSLGQMSTVLEDDEAGLQDGEAGRQDGAAGRQDGEAGRQDGEANLSALRPV